jgi:murein DD-endopeptidase MepM/ murein hydrolase activator NlpD
LELKRKAGFLIKMLSVFLCFAVCISCFSAADNYSVVSHAETLAQLQAKQKANKAKLDEIKKKTAAAQNSIAEQKKKQEYIQQQIDVTEDNIRVITEKIELLEADIKAKEESIAAQEQKIAKGIEDFKARLKAMYVSGGDSGMASVLVGAKDFYDLLARMEIIQRISQRDDELIETLNAELKQLKEDKAALEATKAEADSDKAELEQAKADLNSAYEQSEAEQARLKKEIEEYAKNKAEIDKQEAEIEKQIQAIIAAEAAKNKLTYVGGTFTWPLPGYYYISSPYGSRTLFGVTKFHKGVDISGSGVNGKPIVAANGGKVIVANTSYTPGVSYGMYVMIDHGGGYVTLYGHCSALNVTAGQTVNKGDVIAYVGSTGQSTGPHLHFEVRVNGATTNPMNYFTKAN